MTIYVDTDFNGTAGTTPTAAELGVTSISGAGTGVRRLPGTYGTSATHLQTQGQFRYQDDVGLAANAPIYSLMLHRGGWLIPDGEGGYEVDPTDQLPSAVQNIFDVRKSDGTIQGAVAFKSTGKLNLIAKPGGTNKDSTGTYLDGEPYWIAWDYVPDPAGLAGVSKVRILAGEGHSSLTQWTLLETVELTNADIDGTAINDIRGIETGPSTPTWKHTVGRILVQSTPLDIPVPPTGPPSLPRTYDFEGQQVGRYITADREGWSYQEGPGHGIYSDDPAGLLPDSEMCARIKGKRRYGTLLDPTKSIYSFRGYATSPVKPDDSAPFSQFIAEDGRALASAQWLDSGKVVVRIGGVGGEGKLKSVNQYSPGGFWYTHTYDRDSSIQEVVIYSLGGLVQERLIAAADTTEPVYAHEWGTLSGESLFDFIVFWDEVTIADEPLSVGDVGLVDDAGLLWQAHGAVTDDHITIAVKIPGAIQAQAIVTGDGGYSTPDLNTLDETGCALIPVGSLDGQNYVATIRARASAEGPWITVGTPISWNMGLRRGQIGEHTIWSIGCIKNKGILSNPGFDLLKNRIATQVNAMRVDLSGDVDYTNKDDADPEIHVAKRIDAVNTRQAFRDLLFDIAISRKSSDHDGGMAANNEFHGDGILGSKAADRKLYPNYGQSILDPATDWEYTIHGASLDFYADTRSNNKSDPDAVDDDTKTALGLQQREELLNLLHNPPLGVYHFCFHTDMGFIGDDPTRTNAKRDAWWAFPNEKAMIIEAANYFQDVHGGIFEVDQGDHHETIWLEPADNPYGNFLIAGAAGLDRESGNVAKFVNLMPVETQHHPPLVYDADGEVIPAQIANFLEHHRNYTGTTLTVTTRAWDGMTGEMIFQVDRTIEGLTPPATEIGGLLDFQFKFDGVIFGTKAPLDVSAFDKGAMALAVQDVDNVTGSGVMFGRDRIIAPTWTWDLFTGPEAEEVAHARAVWAEFLRVWLDEELLSTPNVVKELQYRVGYEVRSVFGRPRGASSNPAAKLSLGALEGHANFRLADHRVYAPLEEFLLLDMIASSGGGMRLPARFPLQVQDMHPPESTVITVGGETPTPAVVTFWGPCQKAYMSVAGWRIGLVGTLGEDDVVTVDARPWVKSATLNGTASAAGLLEMSARIDKMWLPPGEHVVSYGGIDSTNNAQAKIAWRDAWLDF